MKTYIALLRGVNVGGHNQVRMADLRLMCADLGCEAVETYLNSGNLVFRSSEEDPGALTARLQAALLERLGADAPILIRQPGDLARIQASNPFLNGERSEDPAKLHVMFLSGPPDPANLAKLIIPQGCADEFIPGEQEIYLFCPGGLGRTQLTTAFFERKLKLLSTTRNWNTLNALHRLASAK